nr:tetratricopeptide repeat protein [Yoonia sp.]
MYAYGKSVPQDYAEAVRWYQLAAYQGFADAQRNLALMYRNGLGVLQSDVLTYMWFYIASANGSLKSDELRVELASQMTSTDIIKGNELARECMSSNYQNWRWLVSTCTSICWNCHI